MAEALPAPAHGNGTPQNPINVGEQRRNPVISIVVPIYNVGATLLSACIESALAQTFADFELILVNDASTDDSAAVCERYLTDGRVRLLNLPENCGLSGARNAGIHKSMGRFLCFLDGDDRLYPTILARLLDIATATDADIVACGFQKATPSTVITTPVPRQQYKIFSPYEAIEDALYQTRLNHSAWAKLYRRELCVAEPFQPGWYEDLRTFYRIFLRANRIAWTPEPLYLYTINPASYLHTFNPSRSVVLDVTDELVDHMETHCPELAPAARDRALSASFNILNLLTVNNCNEPRIAERCRATIRRYRRESLLNPRVRLKNKLGILLTYIGGFKLLSLMARVCKPML